MGHTRSSILWAGAFAMAFTAVPAQAQFGNIFRDAQRGAERSQGCEEGRSGDVARGIIGGILGGAARRTAGRAAGRAGLPLYAPVAQFTDRLTTEIACILDPQEQEQAALATEAVTAVVEQEDGTEATPEVGRTAAWVSDTREGVSGSSTVTSSEAASGNDCIMVTDVVIVEGEETRAEKRMCRLAGSPRYTIVA